MRRSIIWIPSLIFLMSLAIAGESEKQAGKEEKQAKATKPVENTTLAGSIVCTFCDLKAAGARSNCKAFGHQHGLKTTEGKYVSLLANQYSDPLLKNEAYANKNLKVTGTYYADAAVLDVISYEIDGKKMTWCENHKTMDGCAPGK